MRNAADPSLLCQIFGDRTDERVKLIVAGQLRLTLDRRVAIPIGFCQIERVNKFGELNFPR